MNQFRNAHSAGRNRKLRSTAHEQYWDSSGLLNDSLIIGGKFQFGYVEDTALCEPTGCC